MIIIMRKTLASQVQEKEKVSSSKENCLKSSEMSAKQQQLLPQNISQSQSPQAKVNELTEQSNKQHQVVSSKDPSQSPLTTQKRTRAPTAYNSSGNARKARRSSAALESSKRLVTGQASRQQRQSQQTSSCDISGDLTSTPPTSRPASRAACGIGSADEVKEREGENICAACERPIRERYLLVALDKQWHEDCLKCSCCECRLGEVGSSLFMHSNQIFCRRDFLRIFCRPGHCAACNKDIPPYEMVMRAQENAYHMDCFACQQCQYRFCVGDQFHLSNSHRIVCLLCHQEQQQQQQQQQLSVGELGQLGVNNRTGSSIHPDEESPAELVGARV